MSDIKYIDSKDAIKYGYYPKSTTMISYYTRVCKDGEVVENSILCRRKSDGKIGRYDFVSKTFSEK